MMTMTQPWAYSRSIESAWISVFRSLLGQLTTGARCSTKPPELDADPSGRQRR
jgi:hypothetical protein